MLTSLYIKTPQYDSKFRKFLGRFMFDTMVVQVKRVDNIRVKCIEYTNRSGKVNYSKIDKEIGAQRNRLLCSKSIELPKSGGYKRFESGEYKERLCTNLGISLLSSLSDMNLSVGLIDVDAQFTTLPKYLLKYTDSVVVVTEETDIYKEVNESLLHDIGAPIRLSKSYSSLYNCDIIIAPKGLCESVNTKNGAVILTTKKPKIECCATVVYDYHVELDEKYSDVIPKGVSSTYFASALYTLLKEYKLGSYLPSLCISENKVHTVRSLKVLVENIHTKNLT